MKDHYSNIPKKKRVYVDPSGNAYGLGKGSMSTGDAVIYTGSGTLLSDGHLTLSGAQFKVDSVIVSAYHGTTVESGTLTVQNHVGSATVRGIGSQDFYYAVFN